MNEVDPYIEFLKAKVGFAPSSGFPCEESEVNPILLPHQRACVCWAVQGGRRALFESFGLGKTCQQLEIERLILKKSKEAGTGKTGRGLIVCPLGVRQEFIRDAAMLGIPVCFVKWSHEVGGEGIYLCNYESVRDGRLDVNLFDVCSLDESSVLRSFGSLTYQKFLTLFKDVLWRFVATATPSPNKFKELIHYAGFLGVMDTGLALTKFFQRDSTKANNLTLMPHRAKEFWFWLNSWAIFLQRPSDLGYPDTGYDLPPLEIIYHELDASTDFGKMETNGQGTMMLDAAVGLRDAATEKRNSLEDRVAKMVEIVNAAPPDIHWIIWHTLEDERHAIQKALPGSVAVYGTQDMEEREQAVIDFSEGKLQILSGKPSIIGSGCNLQRHCYSNIVIGVDYKANDMMQLVHRTHRFQQEHQVNVHIIHTESEREILKTLMHKWEQHKTMTETMTAIIREHGLNSISMQEVLQRTIGVERIEVKSKNFCVANNDAVLEARRQEDNSVAEIITSIPFGNHYEYCASYNDFGNTQDNGHFWKQMDFLTPELLRILQPGRIFCCHVKDRQLYGNVTGYGFHTCSPFHAEAILHYIKHGFLYMGMITVVTDVVRENNQTYRLGWTENGKDGTKMGVGSPEYVLLFRKPQSDTGKGYADTPVTKRKPGCIDREGNRVPFTDEGKPIPGDGYSRSCWQVDAHALWRSSGNRLITAEEMAAFGPAKLAKVFTDYTLSNIYDYEFHVRIGEELDMRGALPATFMAIAPGSHHPDVWHDVNRMLTLNGEQSSKGREMHICLARGSRVLTKERGYVAIQDVRVGEHALTHKGRWRPVLAVQNTGVRPVVTVKAQGVPGLTLTPDHKLWTRSSRKNNGKGLCARSRDKAERTDPTWIEAKDTVNSYINLKLPDIEQPSNDSDLYWWVVGRWLACGHIDKRDGAVISCGQHKLPDFLDRIGQYGGNPPHWCGTAYQVLLKDPGRKLRRTLYQCGQGASNKQLPPEAYTLPMQQAKALLDGYLSGDGHYLQSRGRCMATSVSKDLLLGIAMLAQRAYSAIASVYAGDPPGIAIIEGRQVNTKQCWQLSFDVPTDTDRNKPFILEDGAWKRVRDVMLSGEAETWNLRVAEDESFTAEGCIVKNCPLQFDIINRLIERYSMPGELVYDPFCGLGSVPFCALRKGRRGAGSELNTGYFMDSTHYLRRAEAEASAPSLFDFMNSEEEVA